MGGSRKRKVEGAKSSIFWGGWTAYAIVALIVAVVPIGFAVWPLLVPANPDLAVCDSLRKDHVRTVSEPARVETDTSLMEAQRASATAHLSNAAPGGPLATALADQVATYSKVIADAQEKPTSTELVLSDMNQLMDAFSEVAAVCRDLGVEIDAYPGPSSADSSISRQDALSYCAAAMQYLDALANAETVNQAVLNRYSVLARWQSKGLPLEVYRATAIIEAATVLGVAGEGLPEGWGEGALATIQPFCAANGAAGWAKVS